MGIFLGSEKRGMTFPEPIIPPYPGADPYGNTSITANPNSALTISTVWACVGLLCNAVSMLPLEAYRLTGDVPAKLPRPPLLANPSGDMTQSEWLHMVMLSLLLRGNAYGRVMRRDEKTQLPLQIEILNPDKVKLQYGADGRLIYSTGPTQVIPIADVWHVRGMTLPGTLVGLSPIDHMATTLQIDLSSRQFALDFFSGGGIPKAIIKTDQPVNQEQSRTIKDRLLAASRSREPVVLANGLDYQQISVKPEESQFLLTQQGNVAQIARYFGIAPEMVGGSSGGNLAYSSPEMRSIEFLTYGVSFWLKRLEDAMFGLFAEPEYVQFNTAALLRTDAKTAAEVDNMHLAGKTRAPSELRQRDGLPPMTPAQKVETDMVPLTVTPNGGAKALPALKEAPGAVAPVPAADNQTEGVPSG